MKITKFILILIIGIAIMGFNSTGFAWVETGLQDEYMEEEYEITEEKELSAEPEYEAGLMEEHYFIWEEVEPEVESMEEDEYLVDEETVRPVKEEAWDVYGIPEVY